MQEILTVVSVAYLCVGAYFIAKSQSRGIIADLIFAILWPYFVWRHITKGW